MRFEILGPLRAFVGEREVVITARRERTLLAMLLVHANRNVSSDQLIDSIWPTTVPQDARNQLQLCVGRLRRRFADAGGDRNTIATDHGGYRIFVDPDQFDAEVFRRLVAEARASQEPEHAAEAYRSALALWRGPALADIDSPAIRHTATVLDDEQAQVTEECIEIELSLGMARELLPQLQQLTKRHPYREKLHGAYMMALYRSGRHADALAAYRTVRQLLRDDLGVEPGRELQDLHKAVLNHDPSLDAHRPSPGAAPIPRELPADVAGFTGRFDALRALDELLPDGQNPSGPVVISAIAGTAGVGKTALAVHWAHRATERFQDGQLYINLRGYAAEAPLRPIEALSSLLRSLGLAPDQIPTEEAEASARYRSLLAERRILVVLDNARSVDQVRPLLPGGPGCLTLVTSRDRLAGLVARDGARRITLDVLPHNEAYALLTHLIGPARVEAEPVATAKLAKACAYLPLALRIVAAMLDEQPSRGIEHLVSELTVGHRLAALEVEDDQETAVRATFDLSYSAIPEPAQRLFCMLGLVPGPAFTSDAAAALADISLDEAAPLLDRLASAHLVAELSRGRYAFHDLLREYARERAHRDATHHDRSTARIRLLEYYLQFANAAANLLYPQILRVPFAEVESAPHVRFDDHRQALAWLEIERLNLVAAVVDAARNGPQRIAYLLVDALRRYFSSRHHIVDGLIMASAALAAAKREDNAVAGAAAHISIADLRLSSGRYRDAAEGFTVAAALADRAGWADGHAAALGNAALAHTELGNLPLARRLFQQALAVPGGRLIRQRRAVHGANLGTVEQELGMLRQAAGRHATALELYRELGSVAGEASALTNLGAVNHGLGQLVEARTQLTRALAIHQEVGDRSGESVVLERLAMIDIATGHLEDALTHAHAAVAAAVDDNRYRAEALSTLGTVYLAMGRAERALDRQRKALATASRGRVRRVEIVALLGLAAVRCHVGRHDEATEDANRALRYAQKGGYRSLEGQSLTLLAELRFRQGVYTDARAYGDQALVIHRSTEHRIDEARTLALLGRVHSALDEPLVAKRFCQAARHLFDEIGMPIPDDVATMLAEP